VTLSFRPGSGYLEVVCGSMFSGKTEELIRRVRRAMYARLKVRVFKPAVDRRYDPVDVVSHAASRIPSQVVARAEEILELAPPDVDVVAVDEGQFFEIELVDVCRELAGRGVRVVVAGLEQDYLGRPFQTMAALMVEAESVVKNLAICVVCGEPAHRNQRTTPGAGRIVVGGSEAYEARCRRCFRAEGAEPTPLFDALDAPERTERR
jgi:thymidine kinase